MAEYIERESAEDAVGEAYLKGLNPLRELRDVSAADVVPVVRCKDCKFYKESDLLAPNKFCYRLRHPIEARRIGYNFSPDDFCSYGERKDGAGAD